MSTHFEDLEKALHSLTISLNPPPRNDRERDGSIQRFEYTFELAWKTAKRVLQEHGIESLTPKSVIRDCGQKGWINNVEKWFEFLKARNQTSHTYQSVTAERVFELAKEFSGACPKLLEVLKRESGS